MLWIGAILAIGVLIVVHEAGHYIVARLCKMRVDKFSIGFGPGLWKCKRGNTTFQIAPIPFGGYVQINGMLVADEVDERDAHSYPNRPAWQRFLTIFAGPATNYLFAILLGFALYLAVGVQTEVSRYVVSATTPGFGAHEVLRRGDVIVEVNGREVFLGHPERDPDSLSDIVHEHGAQPMSLAILRDDRPLQVTITPRPDPAHKTKDGLPQYRLGIELSPSRREVGVLGALGHALYYPIDRTKIIVTGLVEVIAGREEAQLHGPVGIAKYVRDNLQYGWVQLIQFLMLLNVYLGLFNLFPLPALDGGRLVFLTYEMATRRRANPKVEAAVHMVGIMALMLLMVAVTYSDIADLFKKDG